MRAYYFDNLQDDQRLPHQDPNASPVSPDQLRNIGVLYWHIPLDGYEQRLDEIAKEREYKNRDTINVSKEGLGDVYEQKIKGFFEEHMHEDEEIRYILDGSGYFDVRELPNDRWIRVGVEPGDLLVIPAGIYHRFTLDTGNRIKALRLFKDEPKWIPHNRSDLTDENQFRKDYVRSFGVSVGA